MSIDAWLNSQTTPAVAPAQTCTVFTWGTLPHFDSSNASTSQIKEVVESYVLQVKDSITADEEEEFLHDIFEVFATEKKKQGDNASKAPELLVPPLPAQALATSSGSIQTNM